MSTQLVERMAVEIDGQGDPVVMIHGLGGTSNFWTPVMPVLAGRVRAIRVDLPGSGRSPAGDGALSIQLFVDRIARMMRALGAARAHVAAHSMGTIVAAHLAQQHPGLVRSLLLLGALPAPPDGARTAIRQRAQKARSEGMAEIADQIVAAATSRDTRERNPLAVAFVRESLMRQPPEGYALSCEALADAAPADLARISTRTLLVTGDEDAIGTPSMSRAMAERLPAAAVDVLGRCGHWTAIERAEDVARAMKRFYFGNP
jgi:3-oxoadipate enol-lactonase